MPFPVGRNRVKFTAGKNGLSNTGRCFSGERSHLQ
jgi:hypothetical protein